MGTGKVTAYGYDQAGRILTATQSGGTAPSTWTYTYDSRGNRLTANVTGGAPSTQTLTYNAANQVTTSGYSFDGTGNLTADPAGTYTYNGAEQMTTVSQGASSYAYKYAGTSQVEVLQQQKSGTTYQLVYGRTNQVGLPVLEQAKIGSLTAYLENDPVTGEPLILRTDTGTVSLYVYSGTGNPTGLLRNIGGPAYTYEFDPYGVPVLTSSSGGSGVSQNPFLFKGGIQDRATGWVHYGNRWYNPTIGRWTQQDTLDAPLDPSNANRYAYAGCDPIKNTDPTGRAIGLGCALGTIGGIGLVGLGVAELAGGAIGSVVAAAPTFGASLVAGGALAVGIAGQITFGVYLAGTSLGECLG